MELRGIIYGRTIQLENEPGLPNGQTVTVLLQPVADQRQQVETLPPGEGLRRSFGAWADDAEELDRYLEWNRRQRKTGRREIEP